MATVAVAGVLAMGWAALRLRRYEVAELSMSPALLPGDYLLAITPAGRVRRGQLVVFPHPHRPGFRLVKRVAALAGETLPGDSGPVPPAHAYVLGDRPDLSSGDSRQVGPVNLAGAARVLLRYWPPGRIGGIDRLPPILSPDRADPARPRGGADPG